jgi:hypothetical protein
MRHVVKGLGAAVLLLGLSGCILGNRPQFIRGGSAQNQKTFYLDGAGNLGFGKETVPLGLEDGGYKGEIEHFIWTTYLGPIMDQVVYSYNRRQGRRLADKIARYLDKHPGASVNIIGLSAGSGVAVFALESLPSKYSVDNVVMLSSSLSANYDLTRALKRVRSGLYLFWSPDDPVLRGIVPLVGTVDRENTSSVAGVIGARMPPGGGRETRVLYLNKVHNVRWYSHDSVGPIQLRHAGTTDRSFIRQMVAPILVRSAPREAAPPATQPAQAG